jgi:hypothetical protein
MQMQGNLERSKMTKDKAPTADALREIQKRERTIKLLGWDVIGSDAASNVDRMRALRREIANIREYGTTNPRLAQRLMSAVRHLRLPKERPNRGESEKQ